VGGLHSGIVFFALSLAATQPKIDSKSRSGLKSLAEPWADATSPAGRMVMTVFAGIAEFERDLIVQRTAKERGVRFGRPRSLTPDQVALAVPTAGRRFVRSARSPGMSSSVIPRRPSGSSNASTIGVNRAEMGARMPIRPECRFIFPIDWRELPFRVSDAYGEHNHAGPSSASILFFHSVIAFV